MGNICFPNSAKMEFEQGKVLSLKVPLGSTVHSPRKTFKLHKKCVRASRNTGSFSEVKSKIWKKKNSDWKLLLKIFSQLLISAPLKTCFLSTVLSAVYLIKFTKYFCIKTVSLTQRYRES